MNFQCTVCRRHLTNSSAHNNSRVDCLLFVQIDGKPNEFCLILIIFLGLTCQTTSTQSFRLMLVPLVAMTRQWQFDIQQQLLLLSFFLQHIKLTSAQFELKFVKNFVDKFVSKQNIIFLVHRMHKITQRQNVIQSKWNEWEMGELYII